MYLAPPTLPTPPHLLPTAISLYTANLNGIKANGHHITTRIIQHHTVTAIQELRAHDRTHIDNFKHHIDRTLGTDKYYIAINDHRQHHTTPSSDTNGGVALIIKSEFPGFDDLQHLPEFDIPDRYLVVTTFWGTQPVYLHVVYAPAKAYITNHQPPPLHDPFDDSSDDNTPTCPNPRHATNRKVSFFDSLPRDFPPDAIHIVLGDLNIALNPTLDSSQPRADHHLPRTACLQWLS